MIFLLKKIFNIIFPVIDDRVDSYVKFISFCKRKKMRVLGNIASRNLQLKYGVFLPYNCDFNDSLILRHPSSIVIGDGVRLGNNVTIFQNVTIGRSDTYVANYPKIGDNVIIYAGAVIVGDVEIGANCIIGANSVVTKSIPDNSIAVGAPAKIISRS